MRGVERSLRTVAARALLAFESSEHVIGEQVRPRVVSSANSFAHAEVHGPLQDSRPIVTAADSAAESLPAQSVLPVSEPRKCYASCCG